MRRYTWVRKTADDLEKLGFKSCAVGPFPEAERDLLEALFDEYATALQEVGADEDPALILPNDPHWGDDRGQVTDLRSWLKLKLPRRNWGQISAELRAIKPERHLAALPEEVRSALAAMVAEGEGEEVEEQEEQEDGDGLEHRVDDDQLDDADVDRSAHEEWHAR